MTLRLASGMTSRRLPAVVLALAVGVVGLGLAGCNVFGNGLTGKTWQLTALTQKVPAFQGVVPAEDQSRYTITFRDDGSAAVKADCNNVGATYETTVGGAITITLGPSTLVACPEGSIANQYVTALSSATSYNVHGGELTMDLGNQGTLEFAAAT